MRHCPWLPCRLTAVGFAVAGSWLVPRAGLAAPPHPGDDEIHRQVQEVLARPEFSSEGDPVPWYTRLLIRFFEWLGGLQEASPLFFWILLVGCVALLLLLAAHIVWMVYRVVSVGAGPEEASKAREKRQRLSLAYREEARLHAERGAFTEAIRCLFLALVYRLDESGQVLFQKAFTNREYLTLFGNRPQVEARLRVFVDTLDDHWYGQRPTDRPRYERCLQAFEAFERSR